MSKRPSLAISKTKQNRLIKAKKALDTSQKPMKQTTVMLEADLLYAAKEIALQRKRAGTKPDSITGMIRAALREIVDKSI